MVEKGILTGAERVQWMAELLDGLRTINSGAVSDAEQVQWAEGFLERIRKINLKAVSDAEQFIRGLNTVGDSELATREFDEYLEREDPDKARFFKLAVVLLGIKTEVILDKAELDMDEVDRIVNLGLDGGEDESNC